MSGISRISSRPHYLPPSCCRRIRENGIRAVATTTGTIVGTSGGPVGAVAGAAGGVVIGETINIGIDECSGSRNETTREYINRNCNECVIL